MRRLIKYRLRKISEYIDKCQHQLAQIHGMYAKSGNVEHATRVVMIAKAFEELREGLRKIDIIREQQ